MLSLPAEVIQECILTQLPTAALGACLLTCRKLKECVRSKRPLLLPLASERPSSRTGHKSALKSLAEEKKHVFLWFCNTFNWPVLKRPELNRWGHKQTVHAAKCGNLEVLKLLGIVYGIDVHCISAAAAQGHIHILQYYRSYWNDNSPHGSDRFRRYSIWHEKDDKVWYKAAKNGRLDVLQWVHANVGFDNRCSRWPPRPRSVGSHDEDSGLLVQACRSGRKDLVKWLLDQGCEDTDKMFATAGAAKGGHLELLKWLYEELHFEISPMAFYYAVKRQHDDVVTWIMENIEEADEIFHYSDAWEGGVCEAAAKAGRLDLIKRIHEKFPETYGELWWGRIVKGAIRSGNKELVAWLINQPRCSNDISGPARAARLGDLSLLRVLIEEKDFESGFQWLAEQAAKGGHIHVLEWLFSRKQDLDPVDPLVRLHCYGPHRAAYTSIITAAAYGGHVPVLSWLLGHKEYAAMWKSDENAVQKMALENVLKLGHTRDKYQDKDDALVFLITKGMKPEYVLEILNSKRNRFIGKLLINSGKLNQT